MQTQEGRSFTNTLLECMLISVEDIRMQTGENKQADVNIRTASCTRSILNADENTLCLKSSLWTSCKLSQKSHRYMWKNPQSKQSWDDIREIRPYKTQSTCTEIKRKGVDHLRNTRWCPSVSGTTSAFHPSSPVSSSARYLKASEGRFSLCSCSALPSAWHKLPSSQPRPTAHPSTASVNERFRWARERSFSLSLSTPCLPPSFPHCLSLFLSRSAQWQPMYLHLAMPPAAANTVTDRDHPDLYEREKETERCSAATWHYHICFVLWFFVSLKWILILM